MKHQPVLDGWEDGCDDGSVDGWEDGSVDGCDDGWADGWEDELTFEKVSFEVNNHSIAASTPKWPFFSIASSL